MYDIVCTLKNARCGVSILEVQNQNGFYPKVDVLMKIACILKSTIALGKVENKIDSSTNNQLYEMGSNLVTPFQEKFIFFINIFWVPCKETKLYVHT